MNLRPMLWHTSRVVANETRLQLLWLLFSEGEKTVSQVVFSTGMSQPNASNQLKVLKERGLVMSRRKKMEVIYRAEANGAVEFAPEVLEALRKCCEKEMPFKTLIRHATAFTHERRIEILRVLYERPRSAQALQDATGMSPSALWRHLGKLERRGYVRKAGRFYRVGSTGNPLGRALMALAVR